MAIRKRSTKDLPARFQMEVKRHELEEMERLCEKGGISSKKELLNTALTLLKWAVREKRRGNSIASIDDAGEVQSEPYLHYLENVGLDAVRHLKVVHSRETDAGNNKNKDPLGGQTHELEDEGRIANSVAASG